MSKKMEPDDPAYWMLFDGVESTPVVHNSACYICRDPEFAQMGMPLCRECPACKGHVQADDTICDDCGLSDQHFWELLLSGGDVEKLHLCFETGYPDYAVKEPSEEELKAATVAFAAKRLETNEDDKE